MLLLRFFCFFCAASSAPLPPPPRRRRHKYLFAIGSGDPRIPGQLFTAKAARNSALDELAKRSKTQTPIAVLQALPPDALDELALRRVGKQALQRWLHGTPPSPSYEGTFGTTATPRSVFAALVAAKTNAADARPTAHTDLRNTAFVHIAATLEISERALQHRLDFHFFALSFLHGTRDAHLEQLAKWILLSPIQRYLFARKLWLPTDERQFAMEEEELANIAKESMRVEIGRHASYLATLSVIEVRRAPGSIIGRDRDIV